MSNLQASNLGENTRPLSRLPVCGYSPQPNDPTVPLCNRPATAHIKPLAGDLPANWTIYTCTDHAPLALNTAWDAHPYRPTCSTPRHLWSQGTAFNTSQCVIPRETTA